jgi:hypothetical protein
VLGPITIGVMLRNRDAEMTDFTPKTKLDVQDSSDVKKTYAHPDVIDLLSTDETEGKLLGPVEDLTPDFGPPPLS